MNEALVIGIIADTSNPAAAARLLGDIERLAATDTGFSRVEIVVLENPAGEPAPRATWGIASFNLDIHIHCVERAAQERDAARGRLGRTELPPGRLPIATARTLVQRHAFERATGERAAAWILDEDLRISPLLDAVAKGEPPLSERVRCLRAACVDVAVGPTLGAPPLPARSTVRVNIEDVRRHLDVVASLAPEAGWPDRSAENARVRRALPEFYYDLSRAHEDAGAHPMWLERTHAGETVRSAFARLSAAVAGLLDGVPITRTIPESPALDAGRSPLARGGNTLVLRPALLARIPNVALRVGGRVSRRSDMVWARLAVALEGARFARAPIPVLQDRSGPGRSSFDADKLLDDLRGSALVAALDALIEEGALAGRHPLARDSIRRASAIYVARARERLAAIHRSEERVRTLLDQIVWRVRAPGDRADLLRHLVHAASIEQLLEHVTRLRAAYDSSIGPCDLAAEQPDVERFFAGLLDDIDAYRAGPATALPTTTPRLGA